MLRRSTGFALPVVPRADAVVGPRIELGRALDGALGLEGYALEVGTEAVTLTATEAAGLARGAQTIRQLLPPQIEAPSPSRGPWPMPGVTIRDGPHYAYRGAMLDVARHFFGVADVKHFIDLLTYYKFNVLHLHVTDDQGWRIEIESWPELAEHGGSTQVGGGPGGYFTQADYQELVRYAAERFVTVVPEVDMPGHTNAALASYAKLNCDGKQRELRTDCDMGYSSLCLEGEGPRAHESLLADVIQEIACLTPGPYLHIGGDEIHCDDPDAYAALIRHVKATVERHDKTMIGWEETLRAGLGGDAVVQCWRTDGRYCCQPPDDPDVRLLVSGADRAYMDMKYDDGTPIGLTWAGCIVVEIGYQWDPIDIVPGIQPDQVLGVEAALWTETVKSRRDIEYRVLARLCGYAEIG